MLPRNKFTNSIPFVMASVFLWVYIWWPLGRAAHDAYFNYFHDTRVPPQFFPANPLLTVALFIVLGHALFSPIAWIILGRVFYTRSGALVVSGIIAYLFQALLIFIASGDGMWLNEPNASFFGIWGLANFLAVLGLNAIAAILAPLSMFITARIANRRIEKSA